MELPFTIVFEPPSWEELRALLRMRGHWVAGSIVALTIGTIYLLANVAHADAVAATAVVPFIVTSRPPGARIWLDGRESGATPRDLPVSPGPHSVRLKAEGALETVYALDVSETQRAFDAVLWRGQPAVTRLRATLPGATLMDARLLSDGSIGLSIGLPPGPELQGWRLDPRTGGVTSVLTNVAGERLTFSPDGRYLAYLGTEIGPPRASSAAASSSHPSASMLWFASTDGSPPPAYAWRAPLESNEQLVDASWSPAADRLVVFSHQDLTGGAERSRAWLLAADGSAAQPVLNLPSGVLPGSVAWSPDGRAMSFVAHAGKLNALCMLRTDGSFAYVADLDPSSGGPLEFPVAAWSADGERLAFVAPHQHPPGSTLSLLQSDPEHAVYVAGIDEPTPRLLSETTSDLVTWREDGQLLVVGRPAPDGPLSIRLMDPVGGSQHLVDMPLKAPGRYAAVWDLSRATVLIAAQNAGGALEFSLVRLGAEDAP